MRAHADSDNLCETVLWKNFCIQQGWGREEDEKVCGILDKDAQEEKGAKEQGSCRRNPQEEQMTNKEEEQEDGCVAQWKHGGQSCTEHNFWA